MLATHRLLANVGAAPVCLWRGHRHGLRRGQRWLCSAAVVPPAAEERRFVDMFQVLKREAVADVDTYDVDTASRDWITNMMQYNVPGGKMFRGLHVIQTLKALQAREALSEEDFRKAAVLGWCVEWLQACFLVADDVMDQSITRRGQLCWYKNKSVGLNAVNDSIILESEVYNILRRHFRKERFYVELLDLFHETTYKTLIGQNLDLITAPEDDVDLSRFSMTKYRQIVRYKTAYYSFYLPVAVAMRLHGITDEKIYNGCESILVDIGEFFQIQDDYLDCYGDPDVVGKVGTDIEDNKCGWLINQALNSCTPEQHQILEDNYGNKDPERVKAVKDVYEELRLRDVYKAYEERSHSEIKGKIDALNNVVPKQVFISFVEKIYRRQK